MIEDTVIQSAIQGGPAWVLLVFVYMQLQKIERKLDEVVEGIAYWGKRRKNEN